MLKERECEMVRKKSSFNGGVPPFIIKQVYDTKNSDVIALYHFYVHCAMEQETNQPYALERFCRHNLSLSRERFRRAKKSLKEMGLITQITKHNDDGSWGNPYVRIEHFMRLPLENKAFENNQ